MTVAKSIRTFIPYFKKKKLKTALDYGAGKLRNSCYLAKEGLEVYVSDIREQVEKILQMPEAGEVHGIFAVDELRFQQLDVDLVLSTYVLNIIHDPLQREEFLENIRANLKQGGYFLVEVLCKDCNLNCDQCKVPRNSFSKEELDQMICPRGFKKLAHCHGKHSVSVLYQKTA